MLFRSARVMLTREIAKSKHGKNFRIYVPHTKGGTPIYVHAKVAVMDDRLLRIGSANLNNRSMGLDSECDVTIDAALAANRAAVDHIKMIRETLIAEHLDVKPEQVADRYAETGSLLKVIEEFSGEGKTLEWLDLEQPGPMDEFIANNELLDPTRPDAVFEAPGAHGVKSYFRRKFGYRRLK